MAESSEGVQEEELVKKTGATSIIWTWFGFKVSDSEQKNIICKICRATVTAKRGNTSNLFYHLKTKHVVEYEQSQTMRNAVPLKNQSSSGRKKVTQQLSIAQAFSKGTPYDKKSQRWIDITHSIAVFLCKDMVPFQTVERSGFLDMVNTLDQRYVVPSRKYFSEVEIPKLHAEVRSQVEKELCDIQQYATTTDLWSSRTMDSYISLTIHFIDDEWKLCSKCLQTSYFPEDHTGEFISQGLREALESWGLDEEGMVCITTDNGANVVKAVELNDWTRLQCFGDGLHLAIGRFSQYCFFVVVCFLLDTVGSDKVLISCKFNILYILSYFREQLSCRFDTEA